MVHTSSIHHARNPKKVRHDLKLGNRRRRREKGRPQQLSFQHFPTPAETSFYILIYIYINGSVSSKPVADGVGSKVQRKLA